MSPGRDPAVYLRRNAMGGRSAPLASASDPWPVKRKRPDRPLPIPCPHPTCSAAQCGIHYQGGGSASSSSRNGAPAGSRRQRIASEQEPMTRSIRRNIEKRQPRRGLAPAGWAAGRQRRLLELLDGRYPSRPSASKPICNERTLCVSAVRDDLIPRPASCNLLIARFNDHCAFRTSPPSLDLDRSTCRYFRAASLLLITTSPVLAVSPTAFRQHATARRIVCQASPELSCPCAIDTP